MAFMTNDVAPDGSPVAIYLAIPPGDTPVLIHSAVPEGSTILELGSGPGRITQSLASFGHEVVAIDNSAEMLSHIDYAETVLADLFSLDLGRRFGAVVAASHLINDPVRERRLDLLEVCRRHVLPDGVVLVERYDPGWAAAPTPSESQLGPVHIRFEPISKESGSFTGRVTYTLGEQSWIQQFTAAPVTDQMLAEEARAAGLRLTGWLNETATWAGLSP